MAAPYATFGGKDFHPDPVERAGILCARINRNHPLPDGNKRVAYLAMRELLARQGLNWTPTASVDEIVGVMEALAAGALSETAFIDWLRYQVG